MTVQIGIVLLTFVIFVVLILSNKVKIDQGQKAGIAGVQSTQQSGIRGIKIPVDFNIIVYTRKHIFRKAM